MSELVHAQVAKAAYEIIQGSFDTGEIDDAVFEEMRFDRGLYESLFKARVAVFVDWLRTHETSRMLQAYHKSLPPREALVDYKLDVDIDWALLSILRQMSMHWNPLIHMVSAFPDEDVQVHPDGNDNLAKVPVHAWPKEWDSIRESVGPGHLIDICRRATAADGFTCPKPFLSHALALLNQVEVQREFETTVVANLPNPGRADLIDKLQEICENMRSMDSSSVCNQKEMGLVVRLLMPLGGYEVIGYMQQITMRSLQEEARDWSKAVYSAVYSACVDAYNHLRYRAIDNKPEEKKEGKLEPQTVNVADFMAQLNGWLTNDGEAKSFAPSRVFGNGLPVQEAIPFLNEIANLTLFGHYVDTQLNLQAKDGKADTFLRRYVVLEGRLDKQRGLWLNTHCELFGRKMFTCPRVYIGRQGFCVVYQRRRTVYTRRALVVCAWWVALVYANRALNKTKVAQLDSGEPFDLFPAPPPGGI